MFDLRAVLSRNRVIWRDRGPNCSPGNVNVPCPFCLGDPSFHMAISDDGSSYYCFRNRRHSGRSLHFLFQKLNIPLSELPDTNSSYNAVRTEKEKVKDFSAFSGFISAKDSDTATSYLINRLFQSPLQIVEQFNLKVAVSGKWAQRLIIPLTVGWTGRSMKDWLEPRYLSHTDESGFFYYSHRSSSIILFEGALDAMRVASISSQFDVIGRCGNRISAALLTFLQKKQYLSIFNAPDGDVNFVDFNKDTREIAATCVRSEVKTLTFPSGYKDACIMKESEARSWVMNSTKGLQL